MKKAEEGLPTPDQPNMHGNHGDQLFKLSHSKPICPRCGKKTGYIFEVEVI